MNVYISTLRNARRLQAFTLVELLITMAVSMIILTVLMQVVLSTIRISAGVVSRSEADTEITGIQQWFAAQLKEAVYVLPVGEQLSFSLTDTSSQRLITRQAGSATWTVGTDFMAFVSPPPVPGAACTTTVTDGCFLMDALFLQPRSHWITAAGGSNPGLQSPGNTASFHGEQVMGHYRGPIISAASALFKDKSSVVNKCVANTAPLTCAAVADLKAVLRDRLKSSIKLGKVQFELDHVAQGSSFSSASSQTWLTTAQPFQPGYKFLALGYTAPYVAEVKLSLALQPAWNLRVPSSGTQDTSVTPRNLGRFRSTVRMVP